MLSNGHTFSSTPRYYHLILMTIKTFLMSLFYPNFSHHLMSDQIISPHFFPAHPSSALRSLLTMSIQTLQISPAQSGPVSSLYWALMRRDLSDHSLVSARRPRRRLIKTSAQAERLRDMDLCTLQAGQCGTNAILYFVRIVSEKYWIFQI